MYKVAPWTFARAFSRKLSSSFKLKSYEAPRYVGTGGRGRSVGSSSKGKCPANCFCQ